VSESCVCSSGKKARRRYEQFKKIMSKFNLNNEKQKKSYCRRVIVLGDGNYRSTSTADDSVDGIWKTAGNVLKRQMNNALQENDKDLSKLKNADELQKYPDLHPNTVLGGLKEGNLVSAPTYRMKFTASTKSQNNFAGVYANVKNGSSFGFNATKMKIQKCSYTDRIFATGPKPLFYKSLAPKLDELELDEIKEEFAINGRQTRDTKELESNKEFDMYERQELVLQRLQTALLQKLFLHSDHLPVYAAYEPAQPTVF